jgi:surface protein
MCAVARVANMVSMFNSATAFNQNLASWNVLGVTNFTDMWTGAIALSDCNKKAMYTRWGTNFQTAWPAFNVTTCTVGSVCATCITNSNIGAAVTVWVTDPTTATTTYGNIAGWNTAAVTSMASLFKGKPTFNADISKWNVASVANMYEVCANKIEHQFAI